jgi:FG-GAP repeat protein
MYRRLLLSAFLSPLLIVPTTAARPIHFAKGRTFPSGITHTSRVAVGDFNGDGYPDLAISSTYNDFQHL